MAKAVAPTPPHVVADHGDDVELADTADALPSTTSMAPIRTPHVSCGVTSCAARCLNAEAAMAGALLPAALAAASATDAFGSSALTSGTMSGNATGALLPPPPAVALVGAPTHRRYHDVALSS